MKHLLEDSQELQCFLGGESYAANQIYGCFTLSREESQDVATLVLWSSDLGIIEDPVALWDTTHKTFNSSLELFLLTGRWSSLSLSGKGKRLVKIAIKISVP